MTERDDLDPAGARRLNRGVILTLVFSAFILVIPAVLASMGGMIATALCTLASMVVLWVVARSLRHPR
jgi:VIT1/CCC1 family predicted Fe2+/Mn2+ transporter